MIPCNCEACFKNSSPTYFQFSELQQYQDEGISVINCRKEKIKQVNVRPLIEGVFDNKELQQFYGERNMTDKQNSGDKTVNYNFNAPVAAVGGSGDHHQVSGQVILNESDKEVVSELQESVNNLMQHVMSSEADVNIKMSALNELQEINGHLDNIETIPTETQGRLRNLLGSIKDGSLGAIKLAQNIKDKEETLSWLAEKAVVVSALLSSVPV